MRERITLSSMEKQRCKTVWDSLASDYYSNHHITSRNFDIVIRSNLHKIVPKLFSKKICLDLGGGKSRLQEFYSTNGADIIVCDFSLPMLKANQDANKDLSLVQADSFMLPFKPNTFNAVFSFLGDSFMLEKTFREVYRVLKFDGFFFLALPSKIWRKNIARALGINEDETTFTLRNDKKVKVPSFLYESINLKNALLYVGFGKIESGDWDLSSVVEKHSCSIHVIIAAINQNVAPERLPLVTYALAHKNRGKVISAAS